MKKLLLILLVIVTNTVSSQSIESSELFSNLFVYKVKSETIKAYKTYTKSNHDEPTKVHLSDFQVNTISLHYSSYLETSPDSVFFLTDTGYVNYPITGDVISDDKSDTVIYKFKSFIKNDGTYLVGFVKLTTYSAEVLVVKEDHIIIWESELDN